MRGELSDEGFLRRFDKRVTERIHRELDQRIAKAQVYKPNVTPKAMSAKSELDSMVAELMEKKKLSKASATAEVFRKFPELRESLVRQANRKRQ